MTRLLDSEQFVASRSVTRLLTFCVDSVLEGNEDNLKESTIGIFCFGRSPGYDTKQDPIVRVTARRLRKKLELFYQENEGQGHEVRIALPKGTYIPRFNRLPNTVAPAEPSSDETQAAVSAPAANTNSGVLAKILFKVQPSFISKTNWFKRASWSFVLFLLMASGAVFLARPFLHQGVKAAAPLERPLHLASQATNPANMDADIPSIEKQIQIKRQLLNELSSLVSPTHESLHTHPIANNAKDRVSFAEPRL